jgi:small conductance mechanosensitive channel
MENAMQTIYDFATIYGIKVVGAIVILIVGKIVAGLAGRGVRKACTRANVDATLTGFFAKLANIGVMLFAVLAALAKFGVQTTSFVAVLGAAGFAIGFAMQGSLSNFASGVMILAFRPFGVGDFIDAGGAAGSVKEVGLFTTTLATPDNVKVIVPNSAVFGGTIKNFAGYDTRRVDMVVGIGYSSDIPKAIEVMERLIKEDDRILGDPEPTIAVSELADSSVNFVVRPWVNRADYWAVKFDFNQNVKHAFDQAGIEIPFPQITVHKADAA